jgi:hypothetical protein
MGYADNMVRAAKAAAAKKTSTSNAFGIGNSNQATPKYVAKAKPTYVSKSGPAMAPIEERGIAIPSYAYRSDGSAISPKSIAMANAVNSKITKTSTNDGTTYGAKPASTTPAPGPVQVTPEPEGPVSVTTPEPEPEPAPPPPPEWTLEGDPFYQQALADAQAQFNLERIGAQGTKQYQEVGINRSLDERPATAEASRRRLAGNYAARGMGGGNAGALSRAEAESNAREVTARTGLREQLSELNRQFVGQYGAEGTDWLGTLRGQQARDTASNFALQNRLAGATTVG